MRSDKYFNQNGIALDGYDVLELNLRQRLQKGQEAFSTEWEGVIWRFHSESNLKRFKENPTVYAPAYGGYCAYGVSLGYKAPPDFRAFSVIEGRLFFNFSRYIQAHWMAQHERRIEVADERWKGIADQEMISVFKPWIDLKYRLCKLLGLQFFEEV